MKLRTEAKPGVMQSWPRSTQGLMAIEAVREDEGFHLTTQGHVLSDPSIVNF